MGLISQVQVGSNQPGATGSNQPRAIGSNQPGAIGSNQPGGEGGVRVLLTGPTALQRRWKTPTETIPKGKLVKRKGT